MRHTWLIAPTKAANVFERVVRRETAEGDLGWGECHGGTPVASGPVSQPTIRHGLMSIRRSTFGSGCVLHALDAPHAPIERALSRSRLHCERPQTLTRISERMA
jgi:hypothetical protein